MAKKLLLGLVLALAAGFAAYRFGFSGGEDPLAGIARANGRLELERLDVATLYAGRIERVEVDEGDEVASGAVLARLESATTETQVAEARARRGQLEQSVRRAQAQVEAQRQQLKTAQMDADNARALYRDGLISQSELNARLAQRDAAQAAVQAARSAAAEAQSGVGQAQALVDRASSVMDDLAVRAPKAGRVEYVLAQPGGVLPAGGRVVSLLDLDDAGMDIFLAAPDINRIPLGSEARLVFDGLDAVFPARVRHVAAQAQFTPKFVETAEERTRLMFRVRLKIDADTARRYRRWLKGGMTATGYVRLDQTQSWPAQLAVKLPPAGQPESPAPRVWTAGRWLRKKGLTRFSCASETGRLGTVSSAAARRISAFCGSICSAKRRLAAVYSWAG